MLLPALLSGIPGIGLTCFPSSEIRFTQSLVGNLDGWLLELDVHPFMLSLWRKQAREKVIVARASKLDVETTAELRRLKELERRYKVLKEEHELLKKAIRFASGRKRKSSPSSK